LHNILPLLCSWLLRFDSARFERAPHDGQGAESEEMGAAAMEDRCRNG
jgi:hypothetical protein